MVVRRRASSSNGSPANAISMSMPLAVWRRRRTLFACAKTIASEIRGEKPYRRPSVTRSGNRPTSIKIRASMSRVTRGLPRREAAIPPMMVADTPRSFKSAVKSRRADKRGARKSDDMTGLSDSTPPFPYLFSLFFESLLPSETGDRSHECRRLPQFFGHRRTSQFFRFSNINSLPAFFEFDGFGLGHFHIQIITEVKCTGYSLCSNRVRIQIIQETHLIASPAHPAPSSIPLSA